jgi:type I restriction-modification system DNA methylase subunit
MAVKKTELYSSLWASCDKLRGGMDASQYKDYILKAKGNYRASREPFYGTGIPACIIMIDKEGAAERDGVFMIDASHDFIKDGNKNRLRERDIYKVEYEAKVKSHLQKMGFVWQ